MIPVFDPRALDLLEQHEVEHVAVGRKRALGLDPHAIVMAMQRLAFTSEGDEVRGAELQIAALDQDPPGHVRPPATPHALGRRAATYRHAPPAFLMCCALPCLFASAGQGAARYGREQQHVEEIVRWRTMPRQRHYSMGADSEQRAEPSPFPPSAPLTSADTSGGMALCSGQTSGEAGTSAYLPIRRIRHAAR